MLPAVRLVMRGVADYAKALPEEQRALMQQHMPLPDPAEAEAETEDGSSPGDATGNGAKE